MPDTDTNAKISHYAHDVFGSWQLPFGMGHCRKCGSSILGYDSKWISNYSVEPTLSFRGMHWQTTSKPLVSNMS